MDPAYAARQGGAAQARINWPQDDGQAFNAGAADDDDDLYS